MRWGQQAEKRRATEEEELRVTGHLTRVCGGEGKNQRWMRATSDGP